VTEGTDPAAPAPPADGSAPAPGPAPARRIGVLADDLIWATRLSGFVARGGGVAVRLRTASLLDAALPGLDACVVDLTARAYDGMACLRAAREAGVPTAAVGQHDAPETRRAALEAGAAYVWVYRALADNGERMVSRWISGLSGLSAREEIA
jgi:DNA-binding NarL/FixJ family response regulator